MPNDKTSREYPLPHPENIAVEDVVRIRRAIEKIDEDMSERENKHNQLKSIALFTIVQTDHNTLLAYI